MGSTMFILSPESLNQVNLKKIPALGFGAHQNLFYVGLHYISLIAQTPLYIASCALLTL